MVIRHPSTSLSTVDLCQSHRKAFEAELEAYERKVSRIMARYGGVIERAIRMLGKSDDRPDEPFDRIPMS